MHKNGRWERSNGRTGDFSTKLINKKVAKVGSVIYIHIYKRCERKGKRTTNDCGYERRRLTMTHPNSSSYDIDNSVPWVIFSCIRHLPSAFYLLPSQPLVRGARSVAQEGHIYKSTQHSSARLSREIPSYSNGSNGGSWCSPLFNRDSTPAPLSSPPRPRVVPSRIFIFAPLRRLSISRSYVSFRRLSEHRHALQGITRRTRVAVIYVACSLSLSLSCMYTYV